MFQNWCMQQKWTNCRSGRGEVPLSFRAMKPKRQHFLKTHKNKAFQQQYLSQ